MIYSKIVGTGSYLPKKVLTNKELETMVDTTEEWILERTGIQKRHLVSEGESTASMAKNAARNALDAAGINPTDIDLIVCATTTPDKYFPSTACLVQEALDVGDCPAFDVAAACTGFIYAIDVADLYIKAGRAKNALVIGAESMSKIVDWSDRTTCVLFGDGAGAAVLSASEEPGIISSKLHADGRYKDLLAVSTSLTAGEGAYIRMQGHEVFKIAVNTLGRIVDEILGMNGLEKKSIDWLVPHQANLRIINATAKKLGLPLERVILTVQEHGNTSAASIPLALDVGVRDGRIKKGDTVLLEAFGGGFTWGATLLKY